MNFEKINKEINEYILYEKEIKTLSEIESALEIADTDEYYFIIANYNLGFICKNFYKNGILWI